MAVTANQIQQARKAGYSDDEIVAHLATSEPQMKQAVDAGYAPAEIMAHFDGKKGAVISEYRGDTSGRDVSDMEKEWVNQTQAKTRLEKFKVNAADAMRAIEPIARPTISGVASLGGGLAGLASPMPGGTLVGGTLGWAGGQQLGDVIFGERGGDTSLKAQAIQTGRDMYEGAQGELLGLGLGAGVGKAVSGLSSLKNTRPLQTISETFSRNTPSFTAGGVRKAAGRILNENTGTSPHYEANAAAADELAQNVPGFRASIGEARNDPGLIKLQRGMESQPGAAADLVAQKNAANRQSLSSLLDTSFPTQASVEDTLSALAARKSGIEAGTQVADIAAQRAAQGLKPVAAQTAGRNIIETIETKRVPDKQANNEQYKALGNPTLPTSKTASAIRELESDFRPGDEDVFPSRAISRVKEALQGPKPSMGGHGKPADPVILDAQGLPMRNSVDTTKSQVGFQDLHSLRKDIGRQIRDASTGMNPNRELAAKLQRIKSGIDADIESGMGKNNDYVTAKQGFIDYANKYRTGEVEAVLRRGNQPTGRNMPDALIAKKMMSPDGADGFINVAGQKNAATAMEGYFVDDMLAKASNPQTGELNPKALASWVNKNGVVLDKYGLRSQFDSVNAAHQTLDAAKTAETAFNKTIAAKMLNADPQNAIASAMSGAEGLNAKNTAAIMVKLMKQLDGNPQAIDGLKNGFKDFIVNTIETTKKTIAGDNAISPASIEKALKKYQPAMSVLYRNSPQQLAALRNIQKAVEIQGRSASTPLSGSSGTAENMAIQKTMGFILDRVPGINIAAKLARVGLSALKELNAGEINELVAKALYDPELAQTLMMAAKGQAPKEVERRMGGFLATILKDERGLVGKDINDSTYYRRTNTPNIYNEVEWAMMADDASRVAHYGDYEHSLSLKDIPKDKIFNASDPIFKRLVEKALIKERSLLREHQATPKQITAELDPHSIVESAMVWDNTKLVDLIWDKVLEPLGKIGIKTQDGFLLFDKEYAKPPVKKGRNNL